MNKYTDWLNQTNETCKTGNIWQEAIDQMLIISHLGTTDNCKTVREAVNKINQLIALSIQEHNDPSNLTEQQQRTT